MVNRAGYYRYFIPQIKINCTYSLLKQDGELISICTAGHKSDRFPRNKRKFCISMFDFCPIVLWRSVRIMNLECPTGQQMQTSYYILILASNLNDHTSLTKENKNISNSTFSTLFSSRTSVVSEHVHTGNSIVTT